MSSRYVVGLDIGGTNIKAGLFDESLVQRDGRDLSTGSFESGAQVAAGAIDLAVGVVEDARRKGLDVAGVGLAIPGIVDLQAGVGTLSMILGWRDVHFVDIVAERTGLPVGFGHDVSAGALAEQAVGAASGFTEWLFVALGTGVGSTFMLGGQPYRGYGGYGGELAHIVALPGGPECRCGKHGCVEMVSSAAAVADRYRSASGADDFVPAHEVVRRALAGDEVAAGVWSEAVAALGIVLAGYIDSMNPAAVVVGGGLADAGPALFDPLSDFLSANVAFAKPFPVLRPAVLGSRAGVIGAAIRGWDASGERPYLNPPVSTSPIQ